MNVVVPLTPKDKRGSEILDKLERLTTIPPEVIVDNGDGTRRYHVTWQDADFDVFDETLDGIDAAWRSHLRRYGDY
jgi:hypothetical protein